MNLEAISVAGSIALVFALAFVLLAKSWHLISKSVGANGSFRGSIMLEAAQRFRDELDGLTRRLHVYLTTGLLFAVIFTVSYLLRAEEHFRGLPHWQLLLVQVLIVAVASYSCYRLVSVVLARRRTQFVTDAAIAAGHGLLKLSANRNRVFHDVPCGGGVIDNVIVGLHGVYCVHVVARRPGRDRRVRLNGDVLHFAPGKCSLSLAEFGERTKQLEREFRQVLKHELRVRSVVAVPGWEIDAQSSDEYLIVNERNLAMLRGWKDQNDYLLNEDVDKLQGLLTDRCTRFAGK